MSRIALSAGFKWRDLRGKSIVPFLMVVLFSTQVLASDQSTLARGFAFSDTDSNSCTKHFDRIKYTPLHCSRGSLDNMGTRPNKQSSTNVIDEFIQQVKEQEIYLGVGVYTDHPGKVKGSKLNEDNDLLLLEVDGWFVTKFKNSFHQDSVAAGRYVGWDNIGIYAGGVYGYSIGRLMHGYSYGDPNKKDLLPFIVPVISAQLGSFGFKALVMPDHDRLGISFYSLSIGVHI